tara:strand:+ start:392 stop:670 length:279 start_codon:yes stop_codon:yes gene_type:complete
MAEMTTVIACSNMGLSGAQVYIEQSNEGFEARQAVAIFGSYQMQESDLEKIKYNPFHDDFDDNFVSGKGKSKEAAIEALKADAKSMADSLWI